MGSKDNIFKTLKDYEEVFGRPFPINYPILKFTEEHRKLDALMRRHWQELHPLSRDLFTSFANEFQYIFFQIEEAEKKVQEALEEQENALSDLDEKIDEVAKENISDLEEQKQALENLVTELHDQLTEKEELIGTQREEINLLIDQSDLEIESKKNLEGKITESYDHVTTFAEQLSGIEDDYEKTQKENDALKEELLQKEREIILVEKQYKEEIEKITSLHTSLKEKLRNLAPVVEKIELENKKLKEHNNELSIELSISNKLPEELAQLQDEYDKLLQKNQKMKDLLIRADSQIRKLTDKDKPPKGTLEKPKPLDQFRQAAIKDTFGELGADNLPEDEFGISSLIYQISDNTLESDSSIKTPGGPDSRSSDSTVSVKTAMKESIQKVEKERFPGKEIEDDQNDHAVPGDVLLKKIKEELSEFPNDSKKPEKLLEDEAQPDPKRTHKQQAA
jgi:myosin heavy subunit